MKVPPTLAAILAAATVFLFSSYLPDGLVRLTAGTTVGSFAILILTLFSLKYDLVVGVAVFLAGAALFLESRRRAIERVIAGPTNQGAPIEELSKPARDIVPGEVHPPHQDPEVQDHGYEPSDETGSNDFRAVGESQDEKQPLETVPPHPERVSEFFQAKGLASLG